MKTLTHFSPGGRPDSGDCSVPALRPAAQWLRQRCGCRHRAGDQYRAPGGLSGRDRRRADAGHHQRLMKALTFRPVR